MYKSYRLIFLIGSIVLTSLISLSTHGDPYELQLLINTPPLNLGSVEDNAFLGHPTAEERMKASEMNEWTAAFQGKFKKGTLYSSVAPLGYRTKVWPKPRNGNQVTVQSLSNKMATGVQTKNLGLNHQEVGYFLHTRSAEDLLKTSPGERRNVPMALGYSFPKPEAVFRTRYSYMDMRLKVKVPYFEVETCVDPQSPDCEGIGLLGVWFQFRHKNWLSDQCGYRKYDVVWIGMKIFDSRGPELNKNVVHSDRGYSDNLQQVCNGRNYANPKAIVKSKFEPGRSAYGTVHSGVFRSTSFGYQDIRFKIDHKQFVSAIKKFNSLIKAKHPGEQDRLYSEVPSDYVLENVHLNGEIPYKDGHHVHMGVGVRDFSAKSYY